MRSRSEEADVTYTKEELVQRREVALVGEALNEDGERRDGRGVLRARRGIVGVSTLHVAHEQEGKETNLRGGFADLDELVGEEDDCVSKRSKRVSTCRTAQTRATRQHGAVMGREGEDED